MKKKDNSIFFIQIICSLLIVNYHSNILDIPYLNSIAKGGFILNTIFVFLSGYLLTKSFQNSKKVKFTDFIVKRTQRIYPPLFITLIFTLIYSLATSKEVFFFNYLKWFSGFGYFFENNEIFSNTHLWFISVILVCYLAFIPSYKIIKRYGILYLTLVGSIIIIYNYFMLEDPSYIYINVSNNKIMRLLYHYLIFAIAIFCQQKGKNLNSFSYGKLIAFTTCFIVYSYAIKSSTYSIIALLMVIPIILSIIPILIQVNNKIENNISVFFKLSFITYEIYLIHYLVINSLNEYLHGNILSYPLTFIFSIIFAFLIHKISSIANNFLFKKQKK